MGRSFDEILANVRSGKTATKTKTTTEKSGFDDILSRVRNRMKADEGGLSSEQKRLALGLSDDAYSPTSPKQKNADGSFVSDFLDRADRWFGSAQHDLDNVKWATAADAYDRRSASLAGLTDQFKDVQGWVTQNKGTLDADSYDQISRYLEDFGDNANAVMDAFSNARDVYGKFKSQEEYDTAVRQDGYFKKYDGMTSQDISTTLEGMEDGEEKDWLTAYKGQVEYDEMMDYDLDLGQREVEELEGVLEEYDRLLLQQSTQNPDNPANIRLKRIVATYGSKSQIKDLLAMKKSYLTQAQRAQEGVRLAGVADEESELYDPEFSKFSGYVDDGKTKLIPDIDDVIYDVINGKDMWDKITIGKTWGKISDSEYELLQNVSHMNPDEVAIYNYYYAKDGKEAAENYLSSIQSALNNRAAEARFGDFKGYTGLELLFSIEAGLDQFNSGVENFFNFSDEYIPASATQQLSGMVREDLKDNGPMLPKWMGGASLGQAAYDMGSTTANMLPSILISSFVPGAGQVLGAASMGVSAAGNAYQEMLNLGYDKGQARLYSTLVGGSEAGLQYLLGGIGKLGGVADDAVTKSLLSHVDNAFGRVAIQLGANMVSEGFEEGLQEVLTPWFKEIAFGLDENVNWSDVLYSSLLGALTANLFEGGGIVAQNVGHYTTGKKLQGAGINAEALSKIGSTFSPDTVAYQLAGKVDANTGAYTIGRMFHEIGASMTEQNVQDITQNLIGKGMRESDARKLAQAISTVMDDPSSVTSKQMKLLDANDVLSAAVIAELIDPNTTYYQRQQGYKQTLKQLADSVAAKKNAKKSAAPNSRSVEELEAEANRSVNPFDEEAMARKRAARQELAQMRGEESSTGDTVMDAAMQVAQEQQEAQKATAEQKKQVVAEAYADLGSVTSNPVIVNMPQASRDSLISGYDPTSGLSPQVYVSGVNQAFWYGYEGITMDEKTLPKNSMVRNITKAQRDNAYALGVEARKSADDVGTESVEAVYQAAKEKLGDQADVKRKGEVIFEDGLEQSSIKNKQKRAAVKLAKMVAEATGIDIHVYSGTKEYGFYKNGMVWLNINATMSGQDMMAFTVGHELCHAAKEISPEKFKKFADYLLEKYGEMGKSVEELIQDKIETCAESDYIINEHEAYEEVICDACQRMLLDTNALETMYEFRQAEPDFWEKIVTKIRKIIENIRKLFVDADPGDIETELFKQMDEASKQMLANLYADMLMDTGNKIATIRAAFGDDVVFQTNENGEFTVAKGEDATGTTKLMFNIATWENGGRDTLIEALRNEGYSAEDIKAAVAIMDGKQELVKRLGKQFPEQGRINQATLHTDIKDGHSVMSALVSNGDYPVNIDLLMVCKKRKAYQRVINRLCETGLIQQATLDALAIAEINKILGKYGFETACLGCFVESRRLRIQEWANTIVSEWNAEVKKRNPNAKAFGFGKGEATLTPDEVMTLVGELEGHEKNDKGNLNLGKGNSVQRMGRLMDKVPSLRKTLSVEDLITPDGLASLRRFDSNLFSMVKSRYGSNSPKFVQDFNPYNHELAMYGTVPSKYESLREYLYAIGGARMQSFSDFIVENWFDYCQIVADLAARKLPMHTYTKEIALVKLFGLTGIKINMSLIPDIDRSLGKDFAGLTRDENGKLVLIWSDKDRFKTTGGKSYMQSINFADAVALQNDPRYSGNIGTIAIGISDKQIEVMLDDSRIRMIIPYHASGMNPIFADLVGTSFYKDYTDFQNTTVKHLLDSKGNIRKVKLTKEQAAKLTSGFLFNEMLQELGDARAAAQAYLDWCADASQHTITIGGETYTAVLTPKFDAFSGHENYYKLLEDFNTYDCISGQAAPQGDVQQVYPEGFEDILEAELKAQEGHRQKQAANQAFDKAMAEIEAYLGEHTKADTVFYAEQHGIKLSAKDKKLGAEDKKKLAGLRKGAKMSVPKVVDSDGRQLSPEQQEFFRDSKVRDEQGRLMRLFHGTDNGGFTVFRGETYWFADKVTAETYANPDHGDDTAMLYEVYLNAKNPLVIDAYGYRATGILTDIFASDGGRKRIHHIDDIALYALDNGYDGLIVKNVKDYGPYIEERIGVESDNSLDTGTVYVVFKPDQIKNADNITPTSSPDIRYSMPKVKSDQNDTSYQEPAYQEWDVQTALYDALDHRDMGDDNLIKVGNMPRYITDKLGIEGDFYIYRNHAYENMVTGDRAKTDGRFNLKSHYHGLGIETMTDAVMALENPIMTIATKTKDGNPAVIMILPVDGKNKAPLYAVLSFYSDRKINGDLRKKPHIVLTIAEREFFGSENRSGYAEMVRDAVNDGRVIDYDKKTRGALSVIANQARVGDITEASLTESLAQFLKEIKSFKEKNRINYKTPNSRGMSSRQLLADAFDELVQTPKERELMDQYRANITKVEEVQERLTKLRARIRELTKSGGDKAKIAELNKTAAELSGLIDSYDRKLLELEASKPLRDVLARAKTAAYQEARQRSEENMKKYRQQVAERFDRGVESRRKTAMRQKIRKVIRELDKILNRGDKKRNVKEDMKDFVAEALASAEVLFTDNYTNEDMIRNGVGVELTEDEAKYMEEARAILEEMSNLPSGGYEAFLARQEAEEKLKSRLAYRMSKLKDVFFRERQRVNKTSVSEVLGKLADSYAKLETSEYAYVNGAYHDAVYQYLRMLQEEVGGTIVRDMTLGQLEDLYKAYTMVLTTVRNANTMFAEDLKQGRDELANRVMVEVHDAGGEHGLWTKGQIARNRDSWNNTKPVYAAERVGSSTFSRLFNGLFKGQYQWGLDMDEAKDFRQRIANKYGFKDWDMEKLYAFESSSGDEFQLSLNQIMSLYAYSKREQAHDHLLKGGFVFGRNTEEIVTEHGIKRHYLNRSATAFNVSDEILGSIISKLTGDQKAFVDEMQDYLSTTMGAKGNEVSMRLYGVKLFLEQFYFPLRSAGQYMEKAKEADMKKQQGQISIANSSFSHATKPKASNPIILDGFTDVWASHVNEMSMYHSMVLPMEDFRRVYNYSSPAMEGQSPVGVNSVIENAYGPEATAYFDQLYKELNGGAITDPRETAFKERIGKFKKAAVMLSSSVVVQQFSSIGRAFALIDPKHFIGARVDKKRHKALWAELKQYAPVAIIKEMGGFDTGMGAGATDYLLAESYGKGERIKGFAKDKQYRGDVLGLAPAMADELIWCSIWEAVKRETKSKNADMDVRSEEFLQKAGERFCEVIEKTQVYDSVLARSANMRSKNGLMQMATAFLAEPTTTVNMIEDAIRKGNKKYIARAFGSVAVSILLNNALASLVYAMRDDDEDETFLEKYFQALTSGMLDDINPMTYYPVLKDVWSLLQGYDVERSDMSVVADVVDAVQKAITAFSKYDADMDEDELSEHYKRVGDSLLSLLDAGCSALGIPEKNLRREIMALINTGKTVSEDLFGERDTTWNSFWDAVGGSALDATPIVGLIAGESKQDKLYDAIVSGDIAYVNRLKGGYKDESAYNTAVRKAMRDNDPRVREAAAADINGDPSERVRIAREIIAEGHFSQDNVVAAINAEINALNKGGTETASKPKASGLYKAEDFAMEIANGDQAAANAAKVDIIQTAVKNGKTQEEAEKSFASSAKSELKDLFLTGDISEQEAISALATYCGQTEDEAVADVQYWAFKQDYPDVYADDSWFDKYYAEVADYGIGIDMYMSYRNQVKDITGENKKEGRIAVIHSLPITSAQKDALYYAEGWAASKIHEAPWH